VRTYLHGDADVQRLIARAAVLVTDYSSMAFDAAYIQRPVVYFQFDVDEFLGGAHVARDGYFEHELHGFGPVTRSVDEAVAAVEQALAAPTGQPDARYLARMQAAFPHRDGRCCERVVAAIEGRDLSP
jgi:CDP-glycerol glycerophosphotransferase (TagB/SpsB family)